MTNNLRTRIRQSIEDQTLQTALDNNAERRLNGRAAAFQSIPDWRERRQRAHAIRADVIEHLDEYLAQFIAKNEGNGVIVHRAKDSAEAINIILDISKSLPLRTLSTQRGKDKTLVPLSPVFRGRDLRGEKVLIAKSKSMVSEEIELNHALEKEGIRVVETDLGEYIVQMRHERPSHIITPAAHLKKEQVAELFHEKLGIPYTTDIPTLTATARKVLREVFLTADIGFSGVNFGVAESGTTCIVTNEGNGRMVTTIPPVHIALMGMERLVPNLEDLSLMLSLLPRSATGQKLTVYTQLLNKPLPDQTRHLIILDNGRTRLKNSPLKESLYCIRCGACLNACPVFRELSGHAYIGKDKSIAPYPGPIGSVISPGLLGENFVHLAQASSLCGACKDVCPVDIDLPKLLTRVRAGESPAVDDRQLTTDGAGLTWTTRFGLQMYTRIATHPKLFAASQKFAALTMTLFSPRSQWIRLPAFTGWGYSKDFPRFAGKTFRQRMENGELGVGNRGIENRDSETFQSSNSPTSKPSHLEQFSQELTALGGHVTLTKNPTQSIIEFLNMRGIKKIMLEPNTLDESLLREANIEFTNTPDDQTPVGATNAICGLADTGSVLEADGALHASLLPEIHIAVLKSSDILPSLPDAMKFVKDKNAAVFITGPSRTADIEMTLTIGVHGPKEIHVFVVE
ncbi:MAG: LUD domain-containing protein [Chloroflexi bacterium]|nr:LUD domain-containing protein [Chloroflexota bacterium]